MRPISQLADGRKWSKVIGVVVDDGDTTNSQRVHLCVVLRLHGNRIIIPLSPLVGNKLSVPMTGRAGRRVSYANRGKVIRRLDRRHLDGNEPDPMPIT